jgi:hypothetical protein
MRSAFVSSIHVFSNPVAIQAAYSQMSAHDIQIEYLELPAAA